ncbi:MAG: hypothetical protein JNL82_17060 [Myxococcales bacterium]|nr:hypothetical protein [Myxococcales bacterium]
MRRLLLTFSVLSLACGPKSEPGDDSAGDASGSGGSASSAPTSGDPTTPTTVSTGDTTDAPTTLTTFTTEPPTTVSTVTTEPPTTASTVTTEPPGTASSDTLDTGDTGDTGARCSDAFLFDPDCPDMGAANLECDVFAQDCPEGQKCSAWADDGGDAWNATKCAPVAETPGAPGDACVVEGSAVSGIDDCDRGAMCFFVDPDTAAGTCTRLCSGTPDAPVCPQGTTCVISNAGVLNLCLQTCDPDAPTCPQGQTCQPTPAGPVCL